MRKAVGTFFFLAVAVVVATLPAHAHILDGGYWGNWGNGGWTYQDVLEPATLALLASGIGALAIFRGTRKKK